TRSFLGLPPSEWRNRTLINAAMTAGVFSFDDGGTDNDPTAELLDHSPVVMAPQIQPTIPTAASAAAKVQKATKAVLSSALSSPSNGAVKDDWLDYHTIGHSGDWDVWLYEADAESVAEMNKHFVPLLQSINAERNV